MIAQRGHHATSTIELCEATKLGKGALDYYIGSKERLLVAIHDRVMDKVMIGADRVELVGGPPPKQLVMLGDELLDVIAQLPRPRLGVLARVPGSHRRPRQELPQAPAGVRTAGRIRSGCRNRVRRLPTAGSSAHSSGVARHAQLHLPLVEGGGRLSAHEVASSFADIFIRGLSQSPADSALAD